MADVLLVDDEPDHRTTTRAVLARCHLEVVEAGNSTEAVATMRLAPCRVAIVDLRLPGDDGLATMRALHRLRPSLQVVILTAYPSPQTRRQALHAGAAAYLEKPFAPAALQALVQALLTGAAEPDA